MEVFEERGEAYVKVLLRSQSMRESLSAFIVNSELLEDVFVRGVRRLARRYVRVISPSLVRALSERNSELTPLVTEIEKELDRSFSHEQAVLNTKKTKKEAEGMEKLLQKEEGLAYDLLVDYEREHLSEIQEVIYSA